MRIFKKYYYGMIFHGIRLKNKKVKIKKRKQTKITFEKEADVIQ